MQFTKTRVGYGPFYWLGTHQVQSAISAWHSAAETAPQVTRTAPQVTCRQRLVIWRLVDGKPGHEKQSEGLLQGIEALRSVEVYDFDMRFKALFWRQIRRHALRGAADIPAPDITLGVGHRTHLPTLIARNVCGGKSVVLMKPTLPHRLFDLIFLPRHDRYWRKDNLVETRGVVCPSADHAKAANSGLILLGGTNRHFQWRSTDIAAQVSAIVHASPDVDWQVCDSRRTPGALRNALPAAANLRYRSWQATAGDFLEQALGTARYVWVTADSASMLYEALSAGAQVGVIALDAKRPGRDNKHVRGIRLLLSQGHVFSTTDGFRLQGSLMPPHFYPENRRCAEIVVERLAAPVSSP